MLPAVGDLQGTTVWPEAVAATFQRAFMAWLVELRREASPRLPGVRSVPISSLASESSSAWFEPKTPHSNQV